MKQNGFDAPMRVWCLAMRPRTLPAAGIARTWILLPLLTLPLAVHNIRGVYRASGKALNMRLGATAMLALWFSTAWSIGILFS